MYYNEKADYKIKLNEYGEEVNKGLSKAAREVATAGSKDANERMRLVNLRTGILECVHTGNMPD